MINSQLILSSHLSQSHCTLDSSQKHAVLLAMLDFAALEVQTYRSNEATAINREAASLIPSLVRGELKLWIRSWYLKRAKRQAQLLANTTNRKIYVIRSSDVAYSLLSTADVEYNKRLRIFGKNITAKELTERSDFIAHPLR